MKSATSLWATAAIQTLNGALAEPVYTHKSGGFLFEVKVLGDSFWVTAILADQSRVAFRTAFSPDGFADTKVKQQQADGIIIGLTSALGEYEINIRWPDQERALLHFTTTLQPAEELNVPFWPRDILAYGTAKPDGEIHISQTGTRTGLLYAAFEQSTGGSFLYLQNLTALADYNIDTETSAGGVVGGQWPEMGLSLPPIQSKSLKKDKQYITSDAFIAFSEQTPADQFEVAKGFLAALGQVYLLLPRPDTIYQEYLDILPKALDDLQNNKGCWSHRSGRPYLNAYLCDYDSPPEVMVQLAVLLPLQDYMRWSGDECTMATEISDGLSAFYNEKLGTMMRWLPAQEHKLDGSEEQKKPMVMDAWYLHHPLLNLTRMASWGDNLAKELLLKSVDYAIKVAQHFNYCWPVFYNMETLEVVKAETQPGHGGEKDVAGLYAHVMLQVWELTKEQKYFDEAEKAALSMPQHGFDVLYQSNNTMFAAKAMVLLYKQTKKELYRDLSYLFLANIFKNVALWECKYGFGTNFPSFFELFPLSDAPYIAVYEEQEAYSGVHELLTYADGVELMPAVRLLLSEFVRYSVHRMIYYYPPMLPKEMLAESPKTGEIDPNLWIALEDIHDGWEQSGNVGQEVYGAGLAFGIVPRQYIRLPNQHFMIYSDYPMLHQKIEGNSLQFDLQGDSRLTCQLRIIHKEDSKLPTITIKVDNQDDQQVIDATPGTEWEIHGDQAVQISWEENTRHDKEQ